MVHLQPYHGRAPVYCEPLHFEGALFRPLKCSSHSCVRGLNSAIVCPDTGSSPSMYAHLRALQCGHAHARLAKAVCPPRDRGRIWSTSKPPIWSCAGNWQYSQQLPARLTTASRSGLDGAFMRQTTRQEVPYADGPRLLGPPVSQSCACGRSRPARVIPRALPN